MPETKAHTDTVDFPPHPNALSEGDKLPNGATVYDAVVVEAMKGGECRLSVVLGQWREEYVVWTYNHETGGCGNGIYRDSYHEILRAYADRIEKYE